MKIPSGYVRIPVAGLATGFRRLIKEDLLIVGQATSSFQKEQVVHQMWVETPDFIGVPRGYYLTRLKHRGVEGLIDFPSSYQKLFHAKTFEYRDGQEEIITKAVEACQRHGFGGCVIEARVASGKSLILLEVARKLGHKALVVVPTSVLMRQWIAEINKFYPNWRVGQLYSDTIEVRGYDVVVAMLQSVSLKDDYPDWLYQEFGTLLFDENHLASAKEFSKAAPKFAAKYIIGASGTQARVDGCERVFQFMSGDVLPFLNQVKTLVPHIYFVDTGFAWNGGGNAPLDRKRVKYLSSLCIDQSRNMIIVNQAVRAARSGRKILILSERVNHVKELVDKLRIELASDNIVVGEMVGSTKEEDRVKAHDADIIVATIQLIGTGFNKPELDTLLFAMPSQKVTQAVGRVVRLHPNKKQPIVIDFVDSGSKAGMIFAMSRFKKYLENGYKLFNYKKCFTKEFLWKYQSQLK